MTAGLTTGLAKHVGQMGDPVKRREWAVGNQHRMDGRMARYGPAQRKPTMSSPNCGGLPWR